MTTQMRGELLTGVKTRIGKAASQVVEAAPEVIKRNHEAVAWWKQGVEKRVAFENKRR
jgi:hypothetical protein